MADAGGGLSNLFSAAQNIAKAIGQLNQTLGSLILTVANAWTALQTFNSGISTPSVATLAGGNLVLGNGAAIALGATAGWVEIPTCNGTPTGVPANAAAGKAAIVFDTSVAKKLWVYDPVAAAWKYVALT